MTSIVNFMIMFTKIMFWATITSTLSYLSSLAIGQKEYSPYFYFFIVLYSSIIVFAPVVYNKWMK